MDEHREVTLFITACGRPDLLRRTLVSFLQFNTYPIKTAIIAEDSGNVGIDDFVHELLPFPATVLYNEKRLGQMKSIENGYSHIQTEYVFHCEEDWEFYAPGFIEESFRILDLDSNVTSVQLRSYEDVTGRYGFDIESNPRDTYNIPKTIVLGPNTAQVAFTWNPGLRHRKVFSARLPYCPGEDEATLGFYFHSIGMYSAFTKNRHGYVRHIGWDHHVY